MKVVKEEKDIEVHTVGRINREIYKCITEDIVTDEVWHIGDTTWEKTLKNKKIIYRRK